MGCSAWRVSRFIQSAKDRAKGCCALEILKSKRVNSYPRNIHYQHANATTALSGSSGEITDRLLNVADVAANKCARVVVIVVAVVVVVVVVVF